MMRAADLKEAEQIVAGIAWLEHALTNTIVESGSVRLTKKSSDPLYRPATTDYALTAEARMAALRVMRAGWEARIAEHRRRAAQIGLILEKKA